MPTAASDRLALLRVPAKTAAPITAAARLDPEALRLLRPEQSPREFLEALVRDEKYRDAIKFLAFALPPREAIWWACLGTLSLQAGHLHKEDPVALTAVVRWVLEPTEEHRQEAEARVNMDTAAGLVARAVAWTGGSVRPPSLPALPPGPDFPHRGAYLALVKAVTTGPADKIEEHFRQAVALGMHVARGHFSWNQPTLKGAAPSRITGS
jgi:hypothetical protein